MKHPGAPSSALAHRHLMLLVGVVMLQIVQPLLAQNSIVHRVLFDLAFGAVMVLVSFAILVGRRQRWVAVGLVVPAIAASFAHYLLPQPSQWLAASVFHFFSAAFLGLAVSVILSHILRQRMISGDDRFGAIAGWVLMGLIWGHFFALTDRLIPGSFN